MIPNHLATGRGSQVRDNSAAILIDPIQGVNVTSQRNEEKKYRPLGGSESAAFECLQV
jgi:hypothetical protein